VKYSPPNIQSLLSNQIFVYGANAAGKHGAGAAKLALKWGAVYGKYGFSGQTYGIPTKDLNIETLSLSEIDDHIYDFILFANKNPQLEFLVTKIGCGLALYTPKEIAPLFHKYFIPDNVLLPKEFWELDKAD
jgi:hypothetical protein